MAFRNPFAREIWVLLLVACSGVSGVHAQSIWTPDKIDKVTEYLQQYKKDWSRKDTEVFLSGGGYSVNMGGAAKDGGTTTRSIKTDSGRWVSLIATGQSLLVDGKDVTGHLGNKTTYGSNSPIIEDIKDSQIAAGSQNEVSRDTTRNFSLTISLSLALSISVLLNLYLLRKGKRTHPSADSART